MDLKNSTSLKFMVSDFVRQHRLDVEIEDKLCDAIINWQMQLSLNVKEDDFDNINVKLKTIDAIFFDFDGVMTDNKVYTDQHGNESVRCDRADGLGINQLKELKKRLYILSTEKKPVVIKRAEKIQIPCISGCNDKAEFMRMWLSNHEMEPKQVAFVGNDINDLAVMKEVGLTLCPQDSYISVLKSVDIIIPRDGGDKVVRAVADIFISNDAQLRAEICN